MPEALNPQGECEPSPRADEVLGRLPEENGDTSSRDARDSGRKHKEAANGGIGRVDGLENAKAEDEDETYQREGVEADEEERSPGEKAGNCVDIGMI